MRTTTVIAGTLLAFASTVAMSQDIPRDQSTQLQQQMQPMQPKGNGPAPVPRTGDSSEGGVQSGSSGSGATLMQNREQGMSPESSPAPTQGSQSTGPIKQ
ncbi:hypothetical protein AWB74_08181 [Caballeronia arvi]|uniref:Lipoprotein n=1 Tax=Caballeronia arvi TaxID=1777135 RepID=A0A158L2I4_9BURK|nr:hypothetical protein AWB74_08181 [Caballeronia arvi]